MVTAPPQLSVAVAVPVLLGAVQSPHATTLPYTPLFRSGVSSAKVICWTQALYLPQASVAFQVRSIPALPVQLAAVAASVYAMVTAPPKLSVAVAVPVLLGAVESPHARTLSAGQVIAGGV